MSCVKYNNIIRSQESMLVLQPERDWNFTRQLHTSKRLGSSLKTLYKPRALLKNNSNYRIVKILEEIEQKNENLQGQETKDYQLSFGKHT